MLTQKVTRRGALASLAAFLATTRTVRAAQDKVFKTEVKVVTVLASVRNKKGEIIRELQKEDFTLEEEGRPQNIRYFSHETDLPLTLGLEVDTSGSQRRLIGEEQSASYRFLDKVLRESQDKSFLIHFDFEIELLQDITSSKATMQKALAELAAPDFFNRQRPTLNTGGGGGQQGGGQQGGGQQGGGFPPMGGGRGGGGRRGPMGGGRGGGGNHGGGTCLYDAVLLGSDEVMRHEQGRKALILLTDGVDTGSKVTLPRSIEAAQRADTLVYSLLFADKDAYGGRIFGRGSIPGMDPANGKKVLQQMALETGGGFFEVNKRQTLDQIYAQLDQELRSQYSIGYTPENGPTFGAFRRISLTTRQKDLVVQARKGYYADGQS